MELEPILQIEIPRFLTEQEVLLVSDAALLVIQEDLSAAQTWLRNGHLPSQVTWPVWRSRNNTFSVCIGSMVLDLELGADLPFKGKLWIPH